jgi:hypothetical protein
MLFFPKLNNRDRGKMLTVRSVRNRDDRKSENNTAAEHQQMQQTDGCNSARSNLSRQLTIQFEESYAELTQHHLPAPLL